MIEDALRAEREVGDRSAAAAILKNLASLEGLEGNHPASRALLAQVQEIGRATGNLHLEAQGSAGMGSVDLKEGRVPEGARLLRGAALVLRDLGDRAGLAGALGALAAADRYLGAGPRAAAAILDEALAIARELGDAKLLASLLCQRGHLLLARGESAARELAEADAIVRALPGSPTTSPGEEIASLDPPSATSRPASPSRAASPPPRFHPGSWAGSARGPRPVAAGLRRRSARGFVFACADVWLRGARCWSVRGAVCRVGARLRLRPDVWLRGRRGVGASKAPSVGGGSSSPAPASGFAAGEVLGRPGRRR